MLFRVIQIFALFAGSAALNLTPENFDDETAGKSVFIKFFAPWCGHCKKMAPAWNTLMDEYAGDKTKLVAEVDCTGPGKPLCDGNGVKGFPTLKFGDPSDLEDYKGGRELADFKKHVETKLVASCSPANIDLCDDKKKAEITKFQEMPSDELEALIAEKSAENDEAEADFKKGVEGLQKSYEAMQKAKEAKLEEIKNAGLGLMKAVSKHASKSAAKDEL